MLVRYAAKRIGSMTRLAQICGVSRAAMYKWVNRNGLIPKKHIPTVRQHLSRKE